MKDLLSEIESYWTTRAEGYSEVNHKELNGMQKGAWLEVLKSQFPEKAKEELKILDIGTGPGFFPVILAEARVSGYCGGLYAGDAGYCEEECRESFAEVLRFIRWMRRTWSLKMICLML